MHSLLSAAALVSLFSQTPAPAPTPAPVATAAAAPIENPFISLLPHLGEDLVALPSITNAGILATGGALALVFHNNHDERLRNWVIQQDASSPSSSVGNFVGDGVTQGAAAVAVWLAGRATGSSRVENTGANLIRAQVLNGVLTQGLKLAVNRTRPDGGSHALPSGHTSAAFATAAVIQHDYGVGAALPFYALGGFIGWSRVRTNHHWLSDVAFGAALGMVAGRAASRDRPGQWSAVPVKTPGGFALYLVRTSTGRTSPPRSK